MTKHKGLFGVCEVCGKRLSVDDVIKEPEQICRECMGKGDK